MNTAIKYSYHGNYLMIDEQLLSFNDAMNYCQTNFDSTLATIHSQSNNDEAFHLCSQSSQSSSCSQSTVCWIGGYDIYQNGISTPQWIDGSNMNYTNFYKTYNQLSQFDNKCIRINTVNAWHPVECTDCPVRFLCNNKDKTIKGTTPSPTFALQQLSYINYRKSCDLMESFQCTQIIQNSHNHTVPIAYKSLFTFNESDPFECTNPQLSITFVDSNLSPFTDDYLYVYINGKYVTVCQDPPACFSKVNCMKNYDLSMRTLNNIDITIIRPKIQYPMCSNLSLNANVSIICDYIYIYPLPLSTAIPQKQQLKSKTKTIYDKDVIGNSFSVIFKESEKDAHENSKYSVWFDFKNAMCPRPIFIVDVKGYNERFTCNSTIIINEFKDSKTPYVYKNSKQFELTSCNDKFNILKLNAYDMSQQLRTIQTIQIATVIDFIFDDSLSCWYQFGLNVTVYCSMSTDIDNDLKLESKHQPIYGWIIGIFVGVMICAICICMYVKRNNFSPDDNKQQKDDGGIEMNVLQEGIENFNHNVDRDQGEGMSFNSNQKHQKNKKIKLKQIEGEKEKYIGLNNDVNDIKDVENDKHEAPKAFEFNAYED